MSVNQPTPGRWPRSTCTSTCGPNSSSTALRARARTPYLRGWTLFTHGEAPYEIDPAHHDVRLRLHENARDGIGLACLSLSAPLGIESLRGPSAAALLDAWHEGAAALPSGFRALGVGPPRGARPRRSGRAARRRVRRRPGAGHRRADAGGLGAARAGAGRRRAVREAGARAPRSGGAGLRRRLAARVVAGRGRVRRPAPGCLVGLARRRRPHFPPDRARRLRGGGRARSRAPRAARRPRRFVGSGGPARPRGHLVVRTAGPRRPRARARDRRAGARQRPPVRRPGGGADGRRRHPGGPRHQPPAGTRACP